MKNKKKFLALNILKHDLPAGLTVFFIALPLCLGIALASGAPLYSGILTGIIGGLIVSLISKSVYGVSGPAAGLSTITAAAIISLGDFQFFLLSVVIAGVFQLLLGSFKLGSFANYFPSAVIKGMLAGIGLILISKQIPLALGYDKGDFWSNLFKVEVSNLSLHVSFGVILISLISILILIALERPFAKKIKIIPSALFAVIVGIFLSLFFSYINPDLALKDTELVNIPSSLFANFAFPDFSKFFSNSDIWKNGLIIGVVATLETLLSTEAIDKLDPHKRYTPVNRELIAQGIGNMTCGLLGGLPMTAVIVRGSANIDAGAKSKLSAFIHGLFLLFSILLVPSVLNLIPYATLASILLITGFNLTKPQLYLELWHLGWKQFLPFIITIIIIMAEDLLIGVGAGLILSFCFIFPHNFKTNYKLTKKLQHITEVYDISLFSNVSFLNKVKLKSDLSAIPEYSIVTIDGRQAQYIDYDVLEVISEYETNAHDKHIELHIIGVEKVKVIGNH